MMNTCKRLLLPTVASCTGPRMVTLCIETDCHVNHVLYIYADIYLIMSYVYCTTLVVNWDIALLQLVQIPKTEIVW